MTTLPEREDGGIDWGKIKADNMGFTWRVDEKLYWASHDAFPTMCVAHTIERFAKVLDLAADNNRTVDKELNRFVANYAAMLAEEFRKMKV